MSDVAQPHDRFLKTLLSNPETAGTLLRERLPKEVAELLSPEPPELVDGSFVGGTQPNGLEEQKKSAI